VFAYPNSNNAYAGIDADLAKYILISRIPSEEDQLQVKGYFTHWQGLHQK